MDPGNGWVVCIRRWDETLWFDKVGKFIINELNNAMQRLYFEGIIDSFYLFIEKICKERERREKIVGF